MSAAEGDVPEWFQHALAAPVEEDHIDVDRCRIAYRQWGKVGDPGVVLVHGRGAHSRWWDHIGPLLSEGRCVTALDLSGNGDSGWREKYSWQAWANDIAGVAGKVSTSTCAPVIIGHSMGGRATLLSATSATNDYSGIVLIDVAMGPTWAEGHTPRSPMTPRPHRISATEQEMVKRFRVFPAQKETLPYVLDHVARTSYRKVDGGYTWKSDPETVNTGASVPDDVLTMIPCKLSMIRCENGRVAPQPGPWFSSMVGRRVPITDLPLAFHSPMFDQPLSLVAALRAILSEWNHEAS